MGDGPRRMIYWKNGYDQGGKAKRAVSAGKPLKVRITKGKYRFSVGTIAAKYLEVHNGELYIVTNSFVIKIGGESFRYGPRTTMHYHMEGLAPDARERVRKATVLEKPKSILDRHGVELVPGDHVLLALRKRLVYGIVDLITANALVVRNGKTRSRVPFIEVGTKGLVKLDKDLPSRFLMEKLATAK